MITEEELNRINNINKELHDIDNILKVEISRVSNVNIGIRGGYETHDIPKSIIISFNEMFKNLLELHKSNLLKEYNKIIYPNETQNNKQS